MPQKTRKWYTGLISERYICNRQKGFHGGNVTLATENWQNIESHEKQKQQFKVKCFYKRVYPKTNVSKTNVLD